MSLAESLTRLAPLEVPEAYAEGVALWLDILAGHIAVLDAVQLPDTVEPAPVFRP